MKKEIIRIIKYGFGAGSSFLLDLLLFTLFTLLFGKDTQAIFLSTILARVISSIYNYFFNSRIVFQKKDMKSLLGYFILVIVQMMISAMLVSLVEKFIPIFPTLIKIVIDIIIFIVNYIVQKEVIFK